MEEHRTSKDASLEREPGVDSSDVSDMTLLQTTQSVLWAMLGVQSKRNASRDFSRGKFVHFVLIGVVFTLVFIFILVSIIRYVLGDAA